MRTILLAAALALSGLAAGHAEAGIIPYPNVGHEAPTTQVVGTGNEVFAYFAGSSASFHEQVGMYVNGVLSPAGYIFPNQATPNFTRIDLGFAAAGADVVFALQVYDSFLGVNPTGTSSTPNLHYTGPASYILYSVPSDSGVGPDGAYQFANPDGSNHAYITSYDANQISGIPVAGTYVAFEDLLTNGASGEPSDLNYMDEQFVFTGISSVPEPSSAILLGLGSLTLLAFARRRRHTWLDPKA